MAPKSAGEEVITSAPCLANASASSGFASTDNVLAWILRITASGVPAGGLGLFAFDDDA